MKPFETLSDIRRRSVDAVVAQLGTNNDDLNRHLRAMLGSESAAEGSVIQDPVIEGAHPFVAASRNMEQVPAEVLHPKLVSILDGLAEDDEYRFPKSRKPFRHQMEAWETLSRPGTPQSVLVTSGTGSGKTECFLFPILSDLVRQTEGNSATLEGVQAILLYPLNALIESQRARLSAWTRPLKGKVRYCLYNGDLPQPAQPESERKANPERQIDRHQLRSSPAPILVTNITMLEYMLARAEDQPIIEKSHGKLRWIVLDEAHSLVGAAAAETALLIRRVLLAFDTAPENVHFVATSATIGDDRDTDDKLRQFLAEVAGVPDSQVHVIKGERTLPHQPHGGTVPQLDVSTASPAALYDHLGGQSQVWDFVKALKEKPQPLTSLARLAKSMGTDVEALLSLLASAEKPHPETGEPERLAPMRVHSFERAIPGIWGCINPGCGKSPAGWSFGKLFSVKFDTCDVCDAPVVELITCTECGEPMLEAEEDRTAGKLRPSRRGLARDEFQYEAERDGGLDPEESDDDDDSEEPATQAQYVAKQTILFAAKPSRASRTITLSTTDWRVLAGPSDGAITLRYEEKSNADGACPCCGTNALRGIDNLLRPVRFGAPFLVTAAAPILLEAVDPRPNSQRTLPSSGRGLISFTDSRQGTARMSAKFQAESERNFVRSFIYHAVQGSLSDTADTPEVANLRNVISQMEPMVAANPGLQQIIDQQRAEIAKLTSASMAGVGWNELVDRLSKRPEIEFWLKEVWEPRDPDRLGDPRKLAEFLVLRELFRRPRRANSLETLALASLKFPSIERATTMPRSFTDRGKTLTDWRHYLTAIVNHFIRAKSAVAVDPRTMRWIAPQIRLRPLLGPGRSSGGDKRYVLWPKVPRNLSSLSTPQTLLVLGLNLNIADPGDQDDMENCLQMAWDQLQHVLNSDRDNPALDFSKAVIAPVTEAYRCPVTRKAVEIAPFGLSPYVRVNAAPALVTPLKMPVMPVQLIAPDDPASARSTVSEWLTADERVADLKQAGIWINISDRLALFVDYFRSAEHSAQQESQRLRDYERDFKDGRINILNCSTTMEMGVDIGSVSTVMMTNVPPSIANYRQRVGRAGRRRQPFSMAFTFCRDRPLDREAFSNPLAYLERSMSPPKVALNSRPIVQRHVNAYLLRQYMLSRGGDALKLTIGALMGCPVKVLEGRAENSPVSQFLHWLGEPSTAVASQQHLKKLVARSVLETENTLIEDCRVAMQQVEEVFVHEWEGLRQLARDEGETMKEAGRARMSLELQRLCGEFLLSALADRGFLPGHGFPTNVVTFIPHRSKKAKDEEPSKDGRRHTRLSGPQRSLDLAIRDYAPGSEVVLDGLVHRSAGVLLNWKRPATEEKVREVQSIKRHWHCAQCGAAETSLQDVRACRECGSQVLSVEYLRPSGFAVDYWKKEHADTDRIEYVPPEEPIVSISDEQWVALPIPSLGRYRGSREGSVYYSNNGPSQNGYAVCLHCGRAEPEKETVPAADGQISPSPLDGHRPLRRKAADGPIVCEGVEKRWKIKRHLALGYEITTDVFELQSSFRISDAAATALVIALREALARALGVEADEMGYSVHRSKNELGGDCSSLLVFDRNAGGAGFSISMGDDIAQVLRDAETILDCRNPGCVDGCAACVLTPDAPFEDGKLDRTTALAFVRSHLSFGVAVDPAERFSDDTKLSISVTDEIDRELKRRHNPVVRIYFPEDADLGQVPSWPIMQTLSTWAYRGYRTVVVVPRSAIAQADQASKLTLHALGHRLSQAEGDFAIHIGPAPISRSGAPIFASVTGGPDTAVWVTRDGASRYPGVAWGQPSESSIYRGTVSEIEPTSPTPPSDLLPQSSAKVLLIENNLDRAMSLFGSGMASLIRANLLELGFEAGASITRIEYKDPYVRSPLTAKLLIDTASALLKGSASGFLKITTSPPKPAVFPPKYLWNDWPDQVALSSVQKQYGLLKNVNVDVVVGECGHGRFLDLSFADGRTASVIFDQGFGAWSPTVRDSRTTHDFKQSDHAQAVSMSKANTMLSRKGVWPTYVVLKAM
ncbi:DEAD/DEAH box helicase [Rhizobium sp. NZLR1b]|uniref:DEAD/DEAH box helicase n=1 Tax=Rhizobium sp. NZLR1b TaxID=2731099 RepID=UPI001C83655F|nr:DEAD/DEAH box helicase [Rhizobium sp. NZLR1b]MBX5168783.1 DEAD/DEAH box helicase [Rhizobium sp. NZLR1b]